MKKGLFLVVFFLLSVLSIQTSGKEKASDVELNYQSALESFQNGSYYSALESVEKVLPYQKDKRFKDALLLTAKIYLEIGKKTGLKEYLWRSNYYLNMYIQAGGKQSSDYYYTKAAVFERLSFFERAFTLYKMSLMRDENNILNNKILLGLMRTAVMIGNLDALSKYMIHLTPLSYGESKELTFLLGMKYFYEGNYRLALELFREVYKDFEMYLLDNPDFYFYVGETAFLNTDLSFAKKVFRKIISQVKNDDVIRKSYLRLGDIAVLERDKNEAFNNYLIVINKFPETEENTVARLKMLSLLEHFPDMKEKVKKVEKLTDPIKFTVQTLISNRTNYVGKYALANFGVLVFKNPTEYLLNRLSWELSLLYPVVLNPDQERYIKLLWTSYLEKVDGAKLEMLYSSNPTFFKKVFDRKLLRRIVDTLDFQPKRLDQNIKLLKFLIEKYNNDEDKRYLGLIHYKAGNINEALSVLQSITEKNCQDEIFILSLEKKPLGKKAQNCDISSLPFEIRINYLLLTYKETKDQSLLRNFIEAIKLYSKNEKSGPPSFLIEQISILVPGMFAKKDYKSVVELMEGYYTAFYEKPKKCDTLPYYLISKIRISDFSSIDEMYDKIKDCDTEVSFVAKEVYKNYKFSKEVR